VGDGGVSCRMGMGALHLHFAHLQKKAARVLLGRSRVDRTPLQNENSLGQDPCAIGSMLETACRGIGKCAFKRSQRRVS